MHSPASNQTAFNQLVGIMSYNLTIFTGARFTLVSIDHQILGPDGRDTALEIMTCDEVYTTTQKLPLT